MHPQTSCLNVSIPSAKELAAAPDTPFDISLRPPAFTEFAGQEKVRDQLLVMVEAARQRGDVLEHVRDLPKVISEISRVLKTNGIFFYDTLNRTFISKLVAIKIWQEWKRWAFMPPNLHVWEMFIKPAELKELLSKNGLEWKEHVGSSPNVSIPKMLSYLRKRAKGEWTFEDLGKRFWLIESDDMNILYGGYAVKK